MIREGLVKIVKRQDLDETEMTQIMTEIMSGETTDAQIGALMGALATKGETFAERANPAESLAPVAAELARRLGKPIAFVLSLPALYIIFLVLRAYAIRGGRR